MLRTFLILLVSVFIFSSCGDDQQAKDIGPKNPKIDKLKIRDGFQVDHLYSPSENDQGSWVAMTFDH